MAFYLGIDGGGTKTECVLGDDERVLGRATAASCKIQAVGEAAAREALQRAIRDACAEAGIATRQLSGACIGISGFSRPDIGTRLTVMTNDIGVPNVEVVGDNRIAMQAAFGDGPGVLVIAGTGSIAFGRNSLGEEARSGGWGPAISDEGSGTWIGRNAVSVMMRAADRGERTTLEPAILAEWLVRNREDVATKANQYPAPDFAALFPIVLEAVQDGDAVAVELLTDAGVELAILASDVMGRLWPQASEEPVGVRMAGGIFTASHIIRAAFAQSLRVERADVRVDDAVVEPVLGALALARRSHKQEARA